MTRVKICDIRSTQLVSECVRIGVDMIGIHCVWDASEGPKLALQREIVSACTGLIDVVVVTRQTDPIRVARMVRAVPSNLVQLHGRWTPEAVVRLRREVSDSLPPVGFISVVEVSKDGLQMIDEMQDCSDLVLLDSSLVGGSGERGDPEVLSRCIERLGATRYLIAGGLRPENVAEVILSFSPWGVDVQSGVEIPGGGREKSVPLIERFVRAVRVAL